MVLFLYRREWMVWRHLLQRRQLEEKSDVHGIARKCSPWITDSVLTSQAAKWTSFVSIGLRNELRPPLDDPLVDLTYNWRTWYDNMVPASQAVNDANPDALIFFGGINSDTYLLPIPLGNDLGGVSFNKSSFSYSDKLVLELHKYDNSEPTCAVMEAYLDAAGFDAMDADNPAIKNVMPVILSEFGYAQDMNTSQGTYATCIRNYVVEKHAGWMVWTIAGSYYIREGTQDYDESYGLYILLLQVLRLTSTGILDHDWSDYRSAEVFNTGVRKMMNQTSS